MFLVSAQQKAFLWWEYKCWSPWLADDEKLKKKPLAERPKVVHKKNEIWTKI